MGGELTFWDILNGAGFAMWGLVLCSIVITTVVIERMLAVRGFLPAARELSQKVTKQLSDGAYEEARASCERSDNATGDIFLAGFARKKSSSDNKHIITAIDRERIRVVSALRRRVWCLGTVGALAPFVGLYGTVLGIRNAFIEFRNAGGEGGIEVVSGDIGEALIVTAAGIVVALVAVVLYNYFNQWLKHTATEIRLLCQEVAEHLVEAEGQ